MGLGLDSFLDLTPLEWVGIRNRFIEYKNKADQERWEITRWAVFRTACPPQPKMQGGMLSVTDFILFPWENEPSKQFPVTNEKRFRAAVEKYK